MNNQDVFETALATCRKAVDSCAYELNIVNESASRVAIALERVNALKVVLNMHHTDAVSEHDLTARIKEHECQQALLADLKSQADQRRARVYDGLNALKAYCLNDQHRAAVDALLAELTASSLAEFPLSVSAQGVTVAGNSGIQELQGKIFASGESSMVLTSIAEAVRGMPVSGATESQVTARGVLSPAGAEMKESDDE